MKNIGHPSDGTLNSSTEYRDRLWRQRDQARRADIDYAFRRMEQELIRRERFRLVRNGTIIPASRMPPQLMVKRDGVWYPEIKQY